MVMGLLENLRSFFDERPPTKLNIGGGPTFTYKDWINLDSASDQLSKDFFVISNDIIVYKNFK